MSQDPILVEVQGPVGLITLNRPDQMNTFTAPFARGLNRALVDLDNDEAVRVVVIRGAGKHFSVGIALDQFENKTHEQYRALIREMDAHNHT
ncbi:MAG: enoyl-CoA hydratase/isomerase family protein, partial [Desulfobacteraceae bacterium]|nr:enoyl-CoA hydratase/isomerase family protein [Desulfobacteraceae bacterium]